MEIEDFELYVSEWVKTKIELKNITLIEVEEAFFNASGVYMKETRKEHKTDPPTYWFCSETSDGRVLKICFIPDFKKQRIVLKTAFDAEKWEINTYENNY